MATSSLAAPATAAAIGRDRLSNTSQTIVGSHVFKIDGFSATKDFGVGKCIKSSIFRVGGYDWYIECYPCGNVDESAGWVSLILCRHEDHPRSSVWVECQFRVTGSLKDGSFREPCYVDTDDVTSVDIIEREELESLLMDDCFHVGCTVCIKNSDMTTEIVSGSHVLTVDGYSKIRRAFVTGQSIKSCSLLVGGKSWYLDFYPCGEDEKGAITANLCLGYHGLRGKSEVKVRFEMTLLTDAGQIISSIRDFSTFSERGDSYCCNFATIAEQDSMPLLRDCIKIRCDMAIVKEITAMQAPPERPDLHRDFGDLLASKVGSHVTFEVGGLLFSAHKCVLATRSTAFMDQFFGYAAKDSATQLVHIDNMEPRVFRALLHFIYTDALPEVLEEDKVMMAQGLLVAADRYAMERLKLICADMLCSYIDATMAVTTLELVDKHGCLKLKETCIKIIRDWLAKAAP